VNAKKYPQIKEFDVVEIMNYLFFKILTISLSKLEFCYITEFFSWLNDGNVGGLSWNVNITGINMTVLMTDTHIIR